MAKANMEGIRRTNEEVNRLTREAIGTALVALMGQKEFQDITVTDIVRKAGVSRTAYYNNYYEKEEVLRDLLNKYMDEIIATADSIIDNQIQPEQLFRLIGANWDVYEIFLKAGMGEVMLSEMTRKLCENVAEGNRIERMRMYFWAGALFGVIKFWFTDGRDLSADEVAGMYTSLMTDVFAHRE